LDIVRFGRVKAAKMDNVQLESGIFKKIVEPSMRLRRMFLLTFTIFLILWGFTSTGYTANHSSEIQKIDSQIQQLEEMKRGYEGRALKHENMAEYLQFDQQAVLETRRHLQLADENRNKAELVQEQIDRLNAKKQQLLK
jgi:hypothetical protein